MSYLILISSILLAAFGMLSLKHGMNKVGHIEFNLNTLFKTALKMYLNPFVIIGITSFGVSTLLWLVVLSKFELSYVYPIVSVNYVLVAIASKIFFKENVTKLRWLSIAIICIGVLLVSTS